MDHVSDNIAWHSEIFLFHIPDITRGFKITAAALWEPDWWFWKSEASDDFESI
jgi:hypothetical protein